MEDRAKVLVMPSAPVSDQAASASFEELRRELVTVKAKLAELLNARAIDEMHVLELRRYCARHVKRLDAIASKLGSNK